MNRHIRLLIVVFILSACSPPEDPTLFPEFVSEKAAPIPEKPQVEHKEERQVLWGDTHIHTSYSTDAYTMGVRALPDDAYRFARGGEIEHGAGYGIKIKKPLDFAAVTDHSEYLGVVREKKPEFPHTIKGLRDRLLNDSRLSNTIFMIRSLGDFDLVDVDAAAYEYATLAAWQDTIDTAERHYIPGVFTTFVAYEWSSMPERKNLHRNVIYRGSKVPEIPWSSLESEDPRDLWRELDAQRNQGMDSLAIPHNGNVSDGIMYDSIAFDGLKIDKDYAEARLRNEPIGEIYQVKGSSETHPDLSPNDEFAGFEIYDTKLSNTGGKAKSEGSYIRDALRLGIEFSHAEGFNPYKFGVIGASDSHNASTPAEEDTYHGKLPLLDGSAGIRLAKSTFFPDDMPGGQRWSSAGLAGVWASENTRESIFDAMRRKETYATSGPRIVVRFFGGWGFPVDLLEEQDWVKKADKLGVPMGGNMPVAQAQDAPNFAVAAMRDPDNANLDRIQIIKGWVDAEGNSHEKIYNIAWAGQREIDPKTGKISSVGNTVDAKTATFSNSIGAAALSAIWQDPEFSPEQEAFYYARVLEIPTPRWSTYDAVKLKVKAPEPVSLQERAVTSAIWYQPTE